MADVTLMTSIDRLELWKYALGLVVPVLTGALSRELLQRVRKPETRKYRRRPLPAESVALSRHPGVQRKTANERGDRLGQPVLVGGVQDHRSEVASAELGQKRSQDSL